MALRLISDKGFCYPPYSVASSLRRTTGYKLIGQAHLTEASTTQTGRFLAVFLAKSPLSAGSQFPPRQVRSVQLVEKLLLFTEDD